MYLARAHQGRKVGLVSKTRQREGGRKPQDICHRDSSRSNIKYVVSRQGVDGEGFKSTPINATGILVRLDAWHSVQGGGQ